jgi:FkbM family methyltransferase
MNLSFIKAHRIVINVTRYFYSETFPLLLQLINLFFFGIPNYMKRSIGEWLKYLNSNYVAYMRNKKVLKGLKPEEVEHLKPVVTCNKKWYGSVYGGFYINPDLLSENSVIYSFGIGTDITFDLKCIIKHRVNVYGFDPTPKSIDWVKSRDIHPNFHFYEFGISNETGFQEFYLPDRPKGVSGSMIANPIVSEKLKIKVAMKSFEDLAEQLGHKKIDVIKMDIEGSEYDVIDSIINSTIIVNQYLLEFHDRFYDINHPKSKEVVEKLSAKGYGIYAHSMNYEEISFIKKSLLDPIN